MPTLITRDGRRQRFDYVVREPGCGEHRGLYMTPNGKPCWDCKWFFGLCTSGSAICCQPMSPGSKSTPWIGCCSWERGPDVAGMPGPPAIALQLHWTADGSPAV